MLKAPCPEHDGERADTLKEEHASSQSSVRRCSAALAGIIHKGLEAAIIGILGNARDRWTCR